MLEVRLITLSDYATVSKEGKLTIAGIFDRLNVTKFPTSIVRAFFVATISGSPFTEYKLDLEVKKGAKQVASFQLNSVTGDNGRNNLVVEMVGIPFKEEGEYNFILSHDKKELGRTSLDAVYSESQTEIKMPN